MDRLATGPAPGLGDRSSVLTQALLRGSAANSVAQSPTQAEHQRLSSSGSGGAGSGWRVEDFRHANRRFHDDKTPSVRSELLEAGAGRLSVRDSSTPSRASVGGARSGTSAAHKEVPTGTPKSMAEWAERNAFLIGEDVPSAQGARGGTPAASNRTSQDAMSHPGLV